MCRSCGSPALHDVISFGKVPLTAHFPKPSDPVDTEMLFELDLVSCADCTLVQLRETPPAALMFDENYPYFSSLSQTLMEASRDFADEIGAQLDLSETSQVIEIASNDGYLLQNFVRMGIPALGIEPTPKAAALARSVGVNTLQAFFSEELAQSLVDEGNRADLVIANNVLAHVPDLNGFVAGIRRLLKPKGIASFDVGYLIDLVEKLAFDTIYHEHHCYFSLTALVRLFERNGLEIFDCESISAQGGSLRVFARHQSASSAAHSQMIQDRLLYESTLGVADGRLLSDFSDRVTQLVSQISACLRQLKSDGASISGYGAAAKGAMLLNAAQLDGTVLDYVVDKNTEKQGRLMPGMRIPIVSPDVLQSDPPDYLIILPWNLADEIVGQQKDYALAGGQFIVPLPQFRISNGT
ncbi:class I SAM-dependent methyltransferase [Pararhizobium sp. IMCC21322]|uniref:class I SAM-dependent methyltransferase n=1 Tax=Pararhizobium sp. IMCC21322 TaxID=3067903 RepID=UPI002741BD1B|nr:class I SAM-dependent methyltransferase [Pararhizobium sp. IMCC21322]